MKSLRLTPNVPSAALLFFFALLLHFRASAQNPTVDIVPLPGNVYSIGVTGLNTSDLVFYRFSDGYHKTAMATPANPKANIERKFRMASANVSAFIARKNGPIDLATADVNNPFCATCLPPAVGLNQGEYVRLLPTSWDAFTEPEHPDPLHESRTNPPYTTPELPWYIMPVTIKAPSANSRVFVNIPEGMMVTGVVVKNNYKQVFVSSMPFNITDSDVKSFNYPTPDRFFINMTAVFNNEFNAYLILSSSTELGDESNFEGKMYDANGAQWGPTSHNLVVTHQNPHDPNVLTPSESGECVYEENNEALTYTVEFQNLGAGIADQVDVKIDVNRMVLNPMALQPHMITTKHPLTSFEKFPDKVIFHFEGIDLPGLGADPQPPIKNTIGWVKVSIPIKNCASDFAPTYEFYTGAAVTFFNHHNQFEETIQTNQVTQHTDECNAGSIQCNGAADQFNDPSQLSVLQPFAAKCYPSLVNNDLFIECMAGAEEEIIKLLITDINGKIWDKLDYQSMPNTLFQTKLDMSSIPAGVYIVRVQQGNNSAVSKVVKQ